jgi:hypothetical protein
MNRRSFLHTFAALSATPFLPPFLRARGTDKLQASMWIYLWDLVDEGYDVVLDRLRAHGLTSISLAAAYHAGKFLSPHNPHQKVVFPEDGRIYFHPNPNLYGRITPLVSTLVREGHGLEDVRRAAERHDLETRAWVVCCHNTPLGTMYPDCTVVDAFGDHLVHSLCPCHPEVRHYLKALIADVASTGVGVIELEALQFQGYAHGYHHEREGIQLTVPMRFLLGLCFCPSCEKRAAGQHVDFHGVRDFTRRTLEELFASPARLTERFVSIEDLPADLFRPFRLWRESEVDELLGECVARVPKTRLRPMASVDPLARTMVGVDPQRLAKTAGNILLLGYVQDGAALRSALEPMLPSLPKGKVTVGFQVGLPESGGKSAFLDRLAAARALGMQSFNFYNYGFIPLENLEWIREGLR